MKRSRQLAAIMFTDIEGYTSLMQQNEGKAIEFRLKHREIFNSATEKFSGRILQYFGDGTLSIFSSAVDAIHCAIEMQLNFRKDLIVPVRIGIHTGDIILGDDEIIGDGVNIASRVESLALPGSIIISGKVYDEVKNQESISAHFIKVVKLKNVEHPVEIYAITNQGLAIPTSEEIEVKESSGITVDPDFHKKSLTKPNKKVLILAAAVLTIALIFFIIFKFSGSADEKFDKIPKSIAVLPFINMSNDPEQEYFSDGISEEILNSLVKISGLKVAGRTSAFSFKGKNEDLRTIGDKLNVEMILEGSVRKAKDQVRITAQLINVEDGFHLWSETYDRKFEDIISVQEEIAEQIVEKVKPDVEEEKVEIEKPENMEAYENFLKGSYLFYRDFEDKKRALGYFMKAVEIDPGYAEAHAYIGETYLHLSGFNLMSTSEAYSKARAAARKALSINEYEPRAHKVLAYIHYFYDWDWDAALEDYQMAIRYGLSELNEFILYYDIFANQDFNHAFTVAEQRVKNDPLDIEKHWQLGLCHFFAQNFENAVDFFNNALELDPNYSNGHHWKGAALGYLGRFDEAIESLEKALAITGGEGLANLDLLAVKIQMGRKDEVLPLIESMEFIDPMDAASLYTMMGMKDRAIEWIEKGYQSRSVMMVTLKNMWMWDPLRGESRFIDIYKRMNF